MLKVKTKKGFTIIETIIVIVILGISLPPLSILIVNVMSQNIRSQAWASAVGLAEAEMERVTSLRFSAVADEALAAFSAPFSAYSKEVTVNYVDAADLNTSVVGPTNYKKVEVKISHSVAGTVKLVSLVANDW